MDQQNKVMQRAPSISSCFPERFSGVSPRDEHENVHEKRQHHHQWPMKAAALHALPQPPLAFKAPVDKHLIVEEKLQPHHAPPPPSSSASPPHHHVLPSSSKLNEAAAPDKPVSAPLPPIPSFPHFGKIFSQRTYTPLYNAAMKGHWESAEKFLRSHPGAINVRITKEMDTVLHIAAGAKHTNFVEEVVKMMSPTDLALRNKRNNTALCHAAASGVTKIAETMVNKNRDLPGMRGHKGMTPLYFAALFGHGDMVSYLFRVTDDEHLTEEDYVTVLLATINNDLFDLALTILWRKPELATLRDHNGMTALHILAQKPSAFASTSSLESWQRILYPLIRVEEKYKVGFPSGLVMSDISHTNQVSLYLLEKLWCVVELIVPGIKAVHEKKTMHMQALQLVKLLCEQVSSLEDSTIADLLTHPSQPLLIAAGFGIVELVTELVCSNPDLIWKVDEQSRNIFHVAVMYRREKIFGLIHDLGAHKDMITTYKDPTNDHNLLHLAGKMAPLDQLNSVSGAALQMQRELLWFKDPSNLIYEQEHNTGGVLNWVCDSFFFCALILGSGENCTPFIKADEGQKRPNTENVIHGRAQGSGQRRRGLDEKHRFILHACFHANHHCDVRRYLHGSRRNRQQGLTYFIGIKCLHNVRHIRCIRAVLFGHIHTHVLVHPHLALC
ncbi:ankyrin-3-like isoform X2 [Rhodamnia argentea]|uniref:Ankyrin-3-like isoform X2 n=1 Tax=Rhodamnia argentea TaxID=178133 RepID=A0ABM3H5A0_9MYRT|nr:ankyrin-3-like isoform X2 [Rhodamnia argentea]